MADFTPMRVAEKEIFTVDYVDQLAIGETIVSAVWSSTEPTGTDSSPNSTIYGSPTISGSKVSQLIRPNFADVVYYPICTAQTSLGQTLILPEYNDGALPVTQ